MTEAPIDNVTLENVRVIAPAGLMFRNARGIKLQSTTLTRAIGLPQQ